MKKILLASTAVFGLAGAAAADVSLSGYAEMGIKGGSAMETQFHQDIDVKFSLSGATDGGLSFGATIDLDEVTSSAEVGGSGTFNKSSVWISGEFGKVTLGDTDGAFDWAMTEVSGLTSIADDHSSHAGFNGNGGLDGTYDGQIARYEYSFGDYSVAASVELDDSIANADAVFGVGFKGKADMGGASLGYGVGYQTVSGGDDIAGVSINASMDGGFSAGLNYSSRNSASASDDWNHTGLVVGYTTGALSLEANYGKFDGGNTDSGYGLAANYDLGGGATVMAGYGDTDGGDSTYSIGLGLSF